MSIKQAVFTGEEFTLINNTMIHKVRCPDCGLPQWFSAGVVNCIYCDTAFSVHKLRVISSGKSPEEE